MNAGGNTLLNTGLVMVAHMVRTPETPSLHQGPMKKKRTPYIFPANPGLIRCLVPMGGPANVYNLSKHASLIRGTPGHALCHTQDAQGTQGTMNAHGTVR